MKKRVIASVLMFIIAFSFIVFPVSAVGATSSSLYDADLSTDTLERVNAEVLAGNITSDRDVLRVALKEYQTRKTRAANNIQMSGMAPLDSLTITQVLDTKVDTETQTVKKLVAKTALVVVDENLEQVTPLSNGGLNTEEDYVSFLEYDVYATHTAYFWLEATELSILVFTMQRMTTEVYYQSSTTVNTTLQHQCRYYIGPGLYYTDTAPIITQPVHGRVYGWQPKYLDPVEICDGAYATYAIITCNGQTLTAYCSIGVEYLDG